MSTVTDRNAPPEWFRDSFSRLEEEGSNLRLNGDSRDAVRALAFQLGWSEARVIRVLVNRALSEMDKR